MKSEVLPRLAVALLAACTFCTLEARGQVSAPAFDPPPQQAGTIMDVAISASGATAIYYTTNGSTPTSSDTQYSSPVLVGSSLVLKAIAYSGTTASPVTTGTYTVTGDIGVGDSHVLALLYNENVYGWGANGSGELGNGTTATAQSTAVFMGTDDYGNPFGNIVAVDAGTSHSIMLSGSGTVWTCGDGTYGELGDGGTTDKHAPVQVILTGSSTILTNIGAIGCGGYFCVAVGATVSATTPNVWAWGTAIPQHAGMSCRASDLQGRSVAG
jgi:alpha-tubulin suppressor-like RCC1 family protein